MDGTDDGGTYTLLINLREPARVEFGSAGTRPLDPGRFAYTGSARGPGGFARVDRHHRLAEGEEAVCHWHVDALLGHTASCLAGDVRSAGVEAECTIARSVAGGEVPQPVPGIGATDCRCDSHLAYAPPGDALERAVRRAHERARD